ncbi:methionyl-tRNA formyltransferase [Methanohalophilus levihalophilus]|uniref:methionyl-tRNA formyltransferase n=1 Tax=Methanohalophilus levihalophilus TaxID=1431282 RepID=UPI001AEAC529|nr:methionyl-tRNA formyltransferase [Methanohalophilus levihalophilus]MBP2029466.1 methionyl-tRNA formyltransferase [Methanohalophilus levihalophilus]
MNQKKLNVLFFGNNPLIFDQLFQISNVIGVFCRPSMKKDANISSIIALANKYSIPIFQPTKKELYNYANFIHSLKTDLIIVCGYKYIIPEVIFAIPKFGTINIHPSYLPFYRGQHVINWAIINGEHETGVTLHYLDTGIDTGRIISQSLVPISSKDTARSLHDKIYSKACALLESIVKNIESGCIPEGMEQDDSKATYFKPRKPEDGHINWQKNSIEIVNLIRALTKPWPGAYSYLNGNRFVIWNARVETRSSNSIYGKVVDVTDSSITVSVKNGVLIIDDYAFLDPNGDQLDFIIKTGDQFE